MTETANTAEAKDAADQEAILTINNPQEIEDFLAALRKDDYNRTYTAEPENDTKNSITEDDILSVYCSIVMKEGAAGTASPETDGSSSLIQIDSVYPKNA